MGKKEQLLRAVSGGSQNTGSSSGNSGSWQPSGGGQTKREALFEAVTTQQPTRVENVYTPAEWAAIQAARNQQWRDEQLKDYQDMNALERAWDVVKNTVKGSGKGIMSNLAGAEAAIAGKGTILNDTYAMIRSVLDRNDGVSAGEAIRNWDQLGGARMAGVIPQAVNELSKEVRWGLNKLGANVAPTNETLVNWDQRNRDRIAAAEKNFYDKVGEVNNIYSAGQQKRQAEQQTFTEKTNARYAQSPVAQNVYKYGTMTGTQLPNIALSIAMAFTGNVAGAGATLAGGMAPATTQGLQFISAFNNSSKLRQLGMLAGNSVREIAASPQYWSSVSMETGSAYNEAIEAGVDPGQASAYAVSYGLLSGIIEVGGADEAAGGLEKMPKKVREAILNGDKAKAAWEYGKTIIHEIGEEEWQEMLSNAMRGGMLGEDVPVFSTENENAIINPKRMGQTALDTAITTALMGAGERAIVGGIQGAMDSRTYRGETDALLDTARQVAGEQDAARVEKIGKSSEKKGRMTIGQARQLYSVIDQNNATEQYRSAAEERRTQALGELTQGVVQDNLRETFSRSGIEATDDELAQIAGGYVQERNSVPEYAEAMRDAYQAGQSGNFSLQQAMVNIESAKKVNPVQFRHAFQLGAGLGNTADTATTEGRNKVAANLAFLGTHADAVAELYEDGQNLPRFAMAMEKAVNLYAANGADLNEIYDSARRGKTRDVISMLTPAQIEKAAEIGAEIREEQIQGNQERAEKLQEIRREAEQIRETEQLTPAQVNAKIRDTQEFILTTQQDIDGTLEGLKVARQAEPGIENTAEYQASMSRVTEMQEQVREAKEKLNELRKDRSRAQRKNLGKRKKGTVSYDGGTIEGTQVKGVDRSTMNRQQKIGAAMAEAVADAVDVDIILFDGEAGMGGAYIQGGTVYLNINSAIKSGEVRQSIIAASLSHELTHYMQQFAPEEYQQLRDFIIQEILKVGPDELTRLVRNEQNWHKNKNLSYDEALNEVIANACQTMLFDSQAIRKLARQNMTLAQKVADVLDEICEKIRAAFAEIDTSSHELFRGVRDLEGQLDQVQALWDAGIEAASENRSAVREKNKNTATEGGEVQYQAAEREEILHLQDQIRENMWRFEGKPALATVNSEIAFNENNIGEAVSWIAEKIGAPVTIQRKGFGQVTFTKKRINQGFNYMPGKKGSKGRNAIGQALTTACVAAPEVVINGVQIGHHSDHKGTGVQTWTFAGPVEIDGERGIMAVVVRKTNQNYYKVHRILTPSGDIMVLDNNKAEVSGGGSPENRTLAQPKLSAENSIADAEETVKGERQLHALEDAGVKIEYDPRAPKAQFQLFDSTGAELTEDQEKFFADSKIRDDQGRLKVMYRGGNGDFTVFDRKKSSYSNLYGRGFYFTDSKSHAEQYGKARAFYLNIQNPVQEGTHDITRAQLRKFLQEVGENEDYGLENYGYGATVDSVMRSLRGKDDFGILQDVNATAIGDFVAAVELFNEVNGTSFDGIIAPTETVAFRAEQIKNTDNKTPTSDPDVRFQMISEVEESDKLIAVHNKTMSGLRRMIERGGVPFPSIAIKKAGSGHNHYGPVSIVFGRSRIDPEVNRANRIYGGDAWTPTEPRVEYEADSKKAYKIREQIYKAVGSQTYEALRTGGSLDNDEIERKLGDNEGNIFEAMKGTAVLKYAYLKSIGKEPEVPTREKRLDGFGRYTNEQLLNLFKTVGAERIHRADYNDQEFRQKAADILNEEFIKDFRKRKAARGASKEAIDAVVKSYKEKPVYVAGDISVNAIKDALRTFENDGRKLQKEPDSSSFTSAMRDNKEIEEDPGYRRWIEDLYSGIVKDSGIRNDKDPFTPSGSRRSFKQLHVPATLDNIAKIMGKQNEKGVTSLGGSNLMGTGTKTYRTVEEARADRGRLYDGDYIDEEEFEGPKKVLNDRLQELVEAAAKITSRDYAWEQRDSAREILLEAVRDSKTKTAMDRKLRNEAQWINYDPTLTDELWQLAEDTRNMKVPYFEAKLRRVVYPEEALAYIVEDTAEETDADLLKKMRDQGLNVLTYKAGDKEDRLRVLNSVEGAQFQRYDEQIQGQMMFDEVENSNMHPRMRERLAEAEQLTEDIKSYFAGIPGSSLSAEDIESMMDFDALNNDAISGDMLDPAALVDELLATAETGGEYRRRQAYRLAERLLGHMPALARQNYVGDGNTDRVQDKAFADWYNARHPSLYYPGYQPGDLFEHKYNKGGKAEEIQKEKDYLHGLLESGNLMEPELSEARELLDRLNNPQPGEVFYQQYDDTYQDTEAESSERALAYTRLQNENAMLIDIIDKMSAVVKGKDKTIEKILKKLARSRRSDAEKLAKQLMKEYGSKADLSEVAAAIKEVGDYFVQTPTESLNPEQAKELARKAAGLIAANAEDVLEETRDEVYGQIRDTVKGRKLSIRPEYAGELDQYGGYTAFKKDVAEKFTLTRADRVKNADEFISVDQFYQDLNRTFGDAYFPEAGSDNGPVNEGEMVKIIADAFEAGEPITVNPFEAYMGEATEMIANTIAFRVLNDNVLKPLLPAEAEKAFDQLKAANGENAELRKELDRATTRGEVMKEELDRLQKEGRLSKKELVELRDEVYELTNALKKADREYTALQEQAEQRLEQVREEGRARVTEVRARERERAAKQIDELKKHYQELQKRARERREESAGTKKYREQVKRKAASLYEMLARNDDKHHVPEVLKRPVAEFLESLDFTSKRQLRGGDETKADLKFGERLRELERMLSGQQSYIDGSSNVQADLGGYVDISEENMDYLRTCIEMVDQALKMGREFTINSMNAQQLKQLSNFLSNLNTAIRNLNNFMANARFESIREAAGQDIEQMKKLGNVSERETGKASGFLMWENGTPYYVFRRFGKGGESIFDGFARGWEKMAFRAKEIMAFTENLYTDKEVRDWKTKVNEFTLSDGSKMRITTAQIMELSMLLNREQALKHIEAGGIQIGDIETRKGTKINTAQYHLTMEDILQITGTLDARQRKVAKALQGYMARKGAEWGNEISMRRFGYNFYTEGENYYPIKTVPTDRPMSDQDLPQNASMFRLLNLSSSKSLNPHANNALVVGNIFDTFADHMSDMAKLNGMGLPILDAIKYFNYKEKLPGEGKTFTTETMQATIKQAYGPKALSYFRKLMQDINGMTESGDRGDPGFGKLLSNYKIAAVGANLRVALLQPTSYVRATAVLKPQYMVGIVPSRAAYQEAIKYSGTAVWKSLGYYDTDIARGMRGQIQHDDTWKDKVAEASMKAAELGDQLTWSMLWTACKRQAKGENSNLRGQALMDRTADLFREVVYASQVMDSTLTRSEIMRGKTHFTKAASAFMAEPTLSYNILLDAYSQFRTDERKAGRGAAWQKNGGKIGKAFAVYVSSAAFSAIVESIVDALRDDDDDEAVDKFLQAFLGEDALSSEAGMLQRLKSVWLNGNLGQDLTIIGKLPFVKDIMSIMQGYGASNMATDGIESVMKAIDILKGNGSKRLTPWGKIYKYLQPISQLSGLAISNLSRDAVAIWNATAGMINPEMKLRKYDAIAFTDEMQAGYDEYVKPTGISKAQFQRILSAANTDGNTSVKQDEMGEYLVDALAANEITEEQAQALWKSQWNKESSKTFDKWRGKEEPKSTTSASTKTTSTVGSTAKKSSQPSGQIEGWDDFKTVAPIYGGPKREATYNAKPANMSLTEYTKMLQAADADGNKSLKQDELGFALKAAVQGGQMSWEAAMAVWAAQGWSHDLSWWAAKHP